MKASACWLQVIGSVGLLTWHTDVYLKKACKTLEDRLQSRAAAMFVYFVCAAEHKHVQQSAFHSSLILRCTCMLI